MDDFFFETNFSGINPDIITTKKYRVDRNTIFLTIPDINVNLIQHIKNIGLLFSNCHGIISPNRNIKIFRKNFNGKIQFLELKKQLIQEKIGKIKVYYQLPEFKIPKDKVTSEDIKYIFYDMSIYTQALQFMNEKLSEKMTANIFFNEIQNIYELFKSRNPTVNHELLFLIQNDSGLLHQFLYNLKTYIPPNNLEELNIFDNLGIVSTGNNRIIPVMTKKDSKIILIQKNIYKIGKYFSDEVIEKSEIVSDEKQELTGEEAIQQPTEESFLTNIIDKLSQSKLTNIKATSNDEIKIEVDTEKLSNILKKYKITDPDIIANVQSSLKKYISLKGEKLSKQEAELTVLKAINYTVHGTEEIDEQYIKNPAILIQKINKRDIHKVSLNFPNIPDNIIKPEQVIPNKYTTGVWRQKIEYDRNIHSNVAKLFETVESVSTRPIKIKKIEHEVIDDDITRYLKYIITMQNLTGGSKLPYQVELKVPYPVNDRYFKINGKTYIMATQQFLKPVTKTDKNEVRLLTNYSIIRTGIKNLKFNPSDTKNVINYIKTKYSSLIKTATDEKCEFSDGSIIYLIGEKVYEDKDESVKVNIETGKLTNKDNEDMNIGKNEFIYQKIIEKIQSINKEDRLTKGKKSIPYIYVFLGGIELPLIFYLWQSKGLLTTLNDLGISYNLSELAPKDNEIGIKTKEHGWIIITPDNLREQLIINGLRQFKFKNEFKNLDDPNEIQPIISQQYGSGSINQIRFQNQYSIDPVTKEMLQYENLPTSLSSLISTKCLDTLLNKPPDSLSDLKIYRARLSEIMLNIMHKQIAMAHNTYASRVDEFNDENAQLRLDPDWIMRSIISESGVLQYADAVSPIDEINLASRTIKSGPNGVQNKRAFKPEHRNIHPSQYGTMSATTTPEASQVGLVVSHTITPSIINELGSYGLRDIDSITNFGALSINEALVPFQSEMNSDRLVMASKHATQVTPSDGCDAPLVRTGAEFIVPQISSTRFCHLAKDDGVVLNVDNKIITVKYKGNKIESYDVTPRLSKTKMGLYMSLEFQTCQEGEKFIKGQILASTKNFDKYSNYKSGRNTFIAVMNYMGNNHEDSYTISKDFADTMKRDIVREIQIIIPPNASVLKFEKDLNKDITYDNVLIEFSYDKNLEEYMDANNLNQDIDGEESVDTFYKDQNTIKLMGKDGKIIDIKIFVNDKKTADTKVLQHHKKLTNETKLAIKKLTENAVTEEERLRAVDNFDLSFTKIGGHKIKGFEFVGTRIVYYVKQSIPLTIGDKLAGRYGNKGVVGKIISTELTPTSEITKKNIESFISPISVFSRKNIAMIKELYLGKILYFLNEKAKEMSSDPKIKTDKLITFVLDIYNLITGPELYKQIEENIKEIKPEKLRALLKENKFKFYIIVPPFDKNITFEDLKTAANHLNIPLDERVYIPELKTYTKDPVPVGVSYLQALEQTAEIYSNVRSVGSYQSLTGQATKGKSKEGGQSIGQLDVNALLTINAPALLNELLTLRSDDHFSKREVMNNIINYGKSEIPKNIGERSVTSSLMNTFMLSMGLEIR